MKALPLWQPWASLVAVEAKRVETRHWPCPQRLIGQRIAIHATRTKSELWVCQTEPFLRRLREAHAAGSLVFIDGELPLGAIVATVVVDRCSEMTADAIKAQRRSDPDEFAFGNYQPGRFAWVLRDVERLAAPVPWKGSQGIFEVPSEVLGLPPEPRHEQAALL